MREVSSNQYKVSELSRKEMIVEWKFGRTIHAYYAHAYRTFVCALNVIIKFL